MTDPPAKPPGTQPRGRTPDDPPDSPRSVGYTQSQSIRLATQEAPFELEAGGSIGPVDVEYETYGRLSPRKDNAILIAHALSGDAHAAGWDRHADTPARRYRMRSAGWWDTMIGPGKPIDTDRFFVICSNVLGSCYGTTGPASNDPRTGRPYGLQFPIVTIGDWVRLQARQLDMLGIERLYAVAGGSLGGQQALEWVMAFPERVVRALVFAASPKLSAQGLAFNAVGRQAIMNDPHFRGGDYYHHPTPIHGLAVARMMAHITYLSEEGMHEKFGRRLQDKERPQFSFDVEFEVESYLAHQGRSFLERFDANSYLYITRAMDYYDVAGQWGGGDLVEACRRVRSRVMVVSFSSDWLYTPPQCREFAVAMCRAGRSATYVNVPSRYGHDAFLVETETVGRLMSGFLSEHP
jgi:homoserine O-acetyltransferase/O-succinyltransferase